MTGQVGAVPDMATGAEHTGTVTVAGPPNSAPTWILPLVTGAADSVFDVNEFDYQMYRPLYWLVNGVQPTETPTMSLANEPVWSNGDTSVTFTLKSNYKWSNGDPITSADVLFWFYETKAALKESPANWVAYTPGLGVPDEVKSISAPNASTVTMQLTKAVNPTWFQEDEIGDIQPWPSQAWNIDATGGKHLTDWATNPADAKKIYDYLTVSGQVAVHLREQPAVAGRRRPVQAERLHGVDRCLHHGAEHHLRRAARHHGVQLPGGAVHL